MVNFEKVDNNLRKNHENGRFEKSFDDPRKMHFLNFIKSGNKYYATFYGERSAAMVATFG